MSAPIPAAESLALTRGLGVAENPSRGGGFRGTSRAGQAVARWHDEVHPGAFSMCDQQPCHAVRRVDW